MYGVTVLWFKVNEEVQQGLGRGLEGMSGGQVWLGIRTSAWMLLKTLVVERIQMENSGFSDIYKLEN